MLTLITALGLAGTLAVAFIAARVWIKTGHGEF